MNRRTTTTILITCCVCLFAALSSATTQAARKNREGRVLAALYCETEYQDAMRNADYLRGHERKAARRLARERFDECRGKAKKAYQVEDVMPRLIPR